MASTLASPVLVSTPNVGNVTAVLIAAQNLSRAQLYIFNPGSNVIWVAPQTFVNIGGGGGSTQAAVGVGSVPIQPLQGIMFPGFTNAMTAIAATGATNAIVVWEYYQ